MSNYKESNIDSPQILFKQDIHSSEVNGISFHLESVRDRAVVCGRSM